MTPKHGGGRPAVLKERVEVRLSIEREQLERLRELAAARGLSVSHLIRELVSRHLGEGAE